MSKSMPTIWDLEAHTRAKHEILKAYFASWVSIVGRRFKRVIYVDGFCGPGKYSKGEVGSPVIVADEAGKILSNPKTNLKSDLELELYFIDAHKDRIDHLKTVFGDSPVSDGRMKMKDPILGTFEEQIQPILAPLESQRSYPALLVFIDPFGSKGFTMATVTRILGRTSAEVFMLFDIDGIDRNLMAWADADRKVLTDLYGLQESVFEPLRSIPDQKTRFDRLRNIYIDCLRGNKIAKKILPFRMFNSSGVLIHELVFITNNDLGFLKMKEAMWKADSNGDFRFSDAEVDQAILNLGTIEERLWGFLHDKFRGRTVNGGIVKNFVEQETLYLDKHKRSTLDAHKGEIEVIRKEGRKGRVGYSENVEIKFPA